MGRCLSKAEVLGVGVFSPLSTSGIVPAVSLVLLHPSALQHSKGTKKATLATLESLLFFSGSEACLYGPMVYTLTPCFPSIVAGFAVEIRWRFRIPKLNSLRYRPSL